MAELDDLDLRIVEAMSCNGRMSAAEIAGTIRDVTERTVRSRLNALIEKNLLFVPAITDPSAREGIYMDLAIDTAPGMMADVANKIVDFSEIEWVGYGGGEHDVYASLLVRDQQTALEVVEKVDRIDGVQNVNVTTHLAVLKTHGFRLRAADELRRRLAERQQGGKS